MLKCIIVEDERIARNKIKFYLERNQDTQLIAEYSSATSFIESYNLEDCDLIFLDIHLPDIDGISLAKFIKGKCQVVFTTAYSEYAVEGFNLRAADYLLKPFDYDRFCESIDRVRDSLQLTEANRENKDSLVLKDGKKSYHLKFQDVYYIQGLREYVTWHTSRGNIITLNSLSKLATKLKPKGFLQVHKSFIVNLSHVSMKQGNILTLKNENIPIGKTYREVVEKQFRSVI